MSTSPAGPPPRRFVARFLFLWISGSISAVLVLPYALTLQAEALATVTVPMATIVFASIAQSVVLFAVAVFVGLRAADAVGLPVPLTGAIAARSGVRQAFVALRPVSAALIGAGVGAALILLEVVVFQPLVGAPLQGAVAPSRLQGLLASFYGGIGEELLTRLFLVSAIAWLLRGRAVWLAIALAAVIFGAGHLPTAASLSTLTPLIVTRIVVLNAFGGIVFGWLYWRRGLEAAMIAHFSADIVLHVLFAI